MITFGYAKKYKYSGDGTLLIQARIPNIHGPYSQTDAGGKTIKNYTRDEDLPWYQSVLLPHMPTEGEVVMLQSINESKSSDYVVIGLTGGSYH